MTTSHLPSGKPESVLKDRGPVKEIDVTVDSRQIIWQAGKIAENKDLRGWADAHPFPGRVTP